MRFISPSTGLPPGCAIAADERGYRPVIPALFSHQLSAERGVCGHTGRFSLLRGVLALALLGQVHALPIDFNDKVEAALLCRSEWSTAFWHDYFNRHLQKSIRDWGEARWWASQNATLGGAATLEMFVNLDTSQALMIGALFDQPVESVKRTIEETLKVEFKPVQTLNGLRYMTDTMSVLTSLTNQKTKWYCARWNMGNRERVKPMTPN
ncbi:hypothetical protein ACUHMQ_06495 [Chitinimonas sp. PSY-7]|uniref:hypothetical protein n=1 Tax=Chitinimonas sp. PSY-7 TaxID=3459088 RepID=UPI00403FE357